ncbi:MAG: T9SS type A sorting domain-containing protein [Saprospiraceae bacterium]
MKWQRIIADWNFINEGESLNWFGGLSVLPNQDLIISGTIFGYYPKDKEFRTDIWLLRTDADGCPFPNCKGKLQSITNSIDNKELDGTLSGIKAMPNPTTGRLWVEILEDLIGAKLRFECLNISGNIVMEQNLITSSDVFHIDLSDFASGMYILKFSDEQGRSCNKRIVKQ